MERRAIRKQMLLRKADSNRMLTLDDLFISYAELVNQGLFSRAESVAHQAAMEAIHNGTAQDTQGDGG